MSKAAAKKKSSKSATSKKRQPVRKKASVSKANWWQKIRQRQEAFLKRRPHRSFRITKRVDTKRSLDMEGYFKFSINVWRELKSGKGIFTRLGLLLIVAFLIFSLLMPQMSYNNLRDALNETAGKANFGGSLYRAGLLFVSSISSGNISPASDQSQQIILVLMVIFTWLFVVFILRRQLAKKPVTLRQTLYESGAPLVPTIILTFIMVLQLVPIGIYAIIFAAAKNTELIKGGVGDMLMVLIGVFLLALTLYWLVSTLVALAVVANYGTEPMKAWRIADDMVVGRRGRIVRRLVWHFFQIVTLWVVVALPIILLENELSVNWSWLSEVPVVPFVLLILTIITLIWTSAYIYLLYRRILDDNAGPV